MDVAKQTGAGREFGHTTKNTTHQLNSAGNLINWRSEKDIQEMFSRTIVGRNES
jgi:hypothetical protein